MALGVLPSLHVGVLTSDILSKLPGFFSATWDFVNERGQVFANRSHCAVAYDFYRLAFSAKSTSTRSLLFSFS
jgi:hypothetical protein